MNIVEFGGSETPSPEFPATRVAARVPVEQGQNIPEQASQLRIALQNAERLVVDAWGATLRGSDAPASHQVRLPQGRLPPALVDALGLVLHHAGLFLEGLRAVADALREQIRELPDEALLLSQLHAQVGALAPRLEAVHACTALLLQEPEPGGVPPAKWFHLERNDRALVVRAHASPLLPGAMLRSQLWPFVRGAVLTSATLTGCGSFDFFLAEVGLKGHPGVATLQVASPFDYARQGTLVAHATQAPPRDVAAFTSEMIEALLTDLEQVQAGALVLFTSREQMRLAVDALPAALRERVLVQGQQPRHRLLMRHRERVAAGRASVVFGMQSFGEGLDLPGAQCESLFITKLPFAPPDAPVDEARAEWLRASGGDPFMQLVLPATALRLAQWVGRAIRTEDDHAHVYCYDKRLLHTGYGQRLLRGLPAFRLLERAPMAAAAQ